MQTDAIYNFSTTIVAKNKNINKTHVAWGVEKCTLMPRECPRRVTIWHYASKRYMCRHFDPSKKSIYSDGHRTLFIIKKNWKQPKYA